MFTLKGVTTFLSDWLWGYDFFVSYGHGDGSLNEGGQTRSRYVRTLVAELESGPERFRVFHDETEYDLGADLDAATRRRVRSSSKLLLVARPRAMESEWVRKEIDVAIQGTTDVIVVDVNSTFAHAPSSNKIKALVGESRLRYAENLDDVDGSPSAELLEKLRVGSKRARRDRRRRQSIIAVAVALMTLAGIALVLQRIASDQRALRLVAENSEQLSRAVSLGSAATSNIVDRSYLTGKAMLATAISLSDSPSLHELLATATTHAPTLTYSKRLWHSEVDSKSMPRFLAHRQLIALDGDRALVVAPGGDILLIDDKTGQVLRRRSAGAGSWTMAVSSMAGLGILGSTEGRLATFRLSDLSPVSEVETHLDIRSVGASGDGKTVLVGSASGLYFRKSAELSKNAREPIESHAYGVNAVAALEKVGTLWAAETRLFLTDPESGRTDIVLSDSWAILSIASRAGTICFGGEDRTVYLETAKQKRRLGGHRGEVVDIAISEDGRQVVSVSADGELIFWRPSAGVVLSRVRLPDKRMTSLAIAQGTPDVLALTDDGYLVRFETSPNILPDIQEGSQEIGAGTFSHMFCGDKNCLAVDNYGVTVRVEGPETLATPLFRFDGAGLGVASIDLSPDRSRFALLGNYSSTITVHDAGSGKLLGKVPLEQSGRFAWTSDQTLVASSISTAKLQVFEGRDDKWQLVREVPLGEPNQKITLIKVSPNWKTLAVVQEDGTITVLSASTWNVLSKTQQAMGISSLAVGEDARVAFASNGGVHIVGGGANADFGRGTLVALSHSGNLFAVADEDRFPSVPMSLRHLPLHN